MVDRGQISEREVRPFLRFDQISLRSMNREMALNRLVRTLISFGEASYRHKQIRSELEGQKAYVKHLER
jgi:hypothetical protein